MATTIKVIYKGFKFISQIFVVKERELEIGYPTDVKHVAHIGWDGPSGTGNAPSWMNGFKTPDFTTSLGNMGERRDSSPMSISNWSSQDEQPSADNQQSDMFGDMPHSELHNLPKKHNRKNTKPTSSLKSSASNTRSSRATKSKATHHGREAPPDLLL